MGFRGVLNREGPSLGIGSCTNYMIYIFNYMYGLEGVSSPVIHQVRLTCLWRTCDRRWMFCKGMAEARMVVDMFRRGEGGRPLSYTNNVRAGER